MAVSPRDNQKRPREGRRVSFGSYTLTGNNDRCKLEISKRLDDYDFPNNAGEEVLVELVESVEGKSRLEIVPAGE